MDIQIQWFGNQFNVGIASKEGADPFLAIKGCRIVDGSKGAFVSYPATKNQQTGKFWNHVWGSEKFNAAVLAKAQETMPREEPRRQSRPAAEPLDDCPF